MRATLSFVKERFTRFNTLCFQGQLPHITLTISNSRSTLGVFVHPINPKGSVKDCRIRISSRLDYAEDVLEDTIIHEMIHYWIWYNRLNDSGPHGHIFRSKMEEINRKFNRKISVRHRSTSDEINSDAHSRNNIICFTHWKEGKRCITICARTRILEIYRYFSRVQGLIKMEWYWSSHPNFNRFPVVRTPKAYLVSPDDLDALLTLAHKLDFDGKSFKFAKS